MEFANEMAGHDALENGVYLVQIFLKGEFKAQAIFSHSEKAREWMFTFPHDHDCLCAPFILDAPEVGEVKKEDMN